jgi:hypothetical protein
MCTKDVTKDSTVACIFYELQNIILKRVNVSASTTNTTNSNATVNNSIAADNNTVLRLV